MDLSPDAAVEIVEDGGLEGPIWLACGRTATYVCIPGFITRMSAMRCTGCCRALGYVQGRGSPKNDLELRRMLGLDGSTV